MFGFLRRSAGCNDALDLKSDVHGLEKILKTGIVASSWNSNVQHSSSFSYEKLVSVPQSCHQDSETTVAVFIKTAQKELAKHCTTTRPCNSNPEVASVALIGGYLARAALPFFRDQRLTLPFLALLLTRTGTDSTIPAKNWSRCCLDCRSLQTYFVTGSQLPSRCK